MPSNNDVINVFLKIFGRAKNHRKKFPKYSQTTFSGIVYADFWEGFKHQMILPVQYSKGYHQYWRCTII